MNARLSFSIIGALLSVPTRAKAFQLPAIVADNPGLDTIVSLIVFGGEINEITSGLG